MKKIILLLFISLLIVSSVNAASVNKSKVLKKTTKIRTISIKRKVVKIKWKDQKAAKVFQIRILNSKNKLIKKLKTKNNHKTIKGLKPNKVYKIKIRAKAGKKIGKYSNKFIIQTKLANVKGVPFGFWGMNGYINEGGLEDISNRFNQNVFVVTSTGLNYTVNTLLPLVKKSGNKVVLNMSGGHDNYTTDGNFDLEKWKAQISLWQDSGVQKYIDNGTLIGHMILDDIYLFEQDPTAKDLEEMAKHSKKIMTSLITIVRSRASEMPEGEYKYVDAVINQYSSKMGSINDFMETEHKAAEEENFDIINGLNLCDGGDGSSGQPGWRGSGFYAMSAAEITTYGEALLGMDNVLMFLMWEYDGQEEWPDSTIGSDYFDQLEMQQSLYNLGDLARRI